LAGNSNHRQHGDGALAGNRDCLKSEQQTAWRLCDHLNPEILDNMERARSPAIRAADSMERAHCLKSELQTTWKGRVRLNPKIIDSMERAPVRDSNHRHHRDDAFA
jgi:hypothetical protein